MTAFLAFQLLILLFSVVIHEVSHGYMAEQLGDPTARLAGRLTLNPLKHLDMWGSVIIPILLVVTGSSFIIGWAKPVPYNPFRLTKDLKYGPLKVALAGPASNVAIALVFGFILRFAHQTLPEVAILLLGFIVLINILLAVFNMIPIPPLDGSKILTVLFPRYALQIQSIGLIGIFLVLIFLFLFAGVIFGLTSFFSKLIVGSEVWQRFLISLMG